MLYATRLRIGGAKDRIERLMVVTLLLRELWNTKALNGC